MTDYQRAWIKEQAVRQGHGNMARVIQDLIDVAQDADLRHRAVAALQPRTP
jgi:hypothetical protein